MKPGYLQRNTGNKSFGKGDLNFNAKLTWKDVAEIRALSTSGVTRKELAAKFKVDLSTIAMIINNKRWKVQP